MAPRSPSLSTLLFLIEHICGMRNFSLEGAMAADTRKLLTQDWPEVRGYQTVPCYQNTYIYVQHIPFMSYASSKIITEVRGVRERGASVRSQLP